MKRTALIITFIAGLFTSPLSMADNKIITIHNKGLYPEGIGYDPQTKHFYVSSVARGEIWQVDQNGKSVLFAKNDKFASTIGLHIDDKNDRLLICVSDPGVGEKSSKATIGKLAGLAVYDLNTKKEIAFYNLASTNDKKGHFANDVSIDEKGNSYITDSFSPIIYKVNKQGKISILANYPELQVKQGKFGLNGIVYHPDGFLIVAHYDSGKLYKIDLDNPSNIKEILLKKQTKSWKPTGLDGLLLLKNETLIAVNNDSSGRKNGNFILRLTSHDNWDSASVNGVMPSSNTFPTTLTNSGDKVFVLHAKLHALFSKQPAEKTFEIEQVSFTKVD